MEFLKVLALRGPNLWTRHSVLEAWIDLGAYSELSSEEVPGFNDRLMGWLPTLVEHRCSPGVRGGFFERLRRGTYPAHILEHVALELQGLAGSPVHFGRARAAHVGERLYKVAVEFQEEALARDALEEGRTLLLAAYDDRPFDVAACVARLRKRFAEVSIGPSTAAIVAAAKARGIPTRRLGTGSLVLLGHGASQRRIWTAETDRTSAVAQEIAQDKDLTRQLLNAVGVPVPEGQPVHSADAAWEAAEEIGLPVVVKPRFGNQGRAVATNLATREAVVAAYEAAHREGQGAVLVERWVAGDDYRLLVVGDRLVAAARRLPAQVVGDGERTVRQLVEEVNRDPRRSEGHATALSPIKLNDPVAVAVLAEQGLSPESVPDAGRVVLIRRNANLSTGGTAEDVTDRVHPDLAARAVEAARVVGLDIAGIDLLAQDVSRPLAEQSAAVVEVNAGPGLRMHLEPSSGTPRPVAEAIVDLVFPPGADGRIPIVAVTGVNGKTTTTRLTAYLLRRRGLRVAWTCTDGLYLDDRRLDAADCSGPRSAQAALLNPAAEAAVLETARGGILRNGLGFDACDVAVVTNIGEGDHLGLSDVHTPEDLARVKSVIVRNVRPSGAAVLNAADPLVAAMAEACPGRVCYFALDPDQPVLAAHRERGGAAAFVRRGVLTIAEDGVETPILPLSEVPLTFGGRVKFQVENALAATAAAWLAGCPLPALRAGLASFAADTRLAPGRFNVLRGRGATVVLDYGHNVDSLRAVGASLDSFPHRRRLAMFTVAGDRRDRDVIDQGELLGNLFDTVVIYEDTCVRGRAPGEIVRLMREGLARGRRMAEVLEAPGEFAAVNLVLDRLQPGDLVLIQPDRVDELLGHVAARLGDGWTGPSLQDLASALPASGGIQADAEEDPEPLIRAALEGED